VKNNENQQYLTDVQVSELTGIGLSTLRNHRVKKVGMSYIKYGRAVRYKREDVIAYMDSHRVKMRVR
jgi:predicted DNA-binding transcriptional regulator AlpA